MTAANRRAGGEIERAAVGDEIAIENQHAHRQCKPETRRAFAFHGAIAVPRLEGVAIS